MTIVSIASFSLAALALAGVVQAAPPAGAAPDNPLLAPWSGPYGGVPQFDQYKVEQLKPALDASMAEPLAEIDKIANDPAPATFANTIAAMENSGRSLDRVSNVFGIYS
ncbi:MAG: M3 family peptidase, partial [Vicinamibacteria bacterium]|nr:M3 family peptidase [Vicinamibacteria bacterium]